MDEKTKQAWKDEDLRQAVAEYLYDNTTESHTDVYTHADAIYALYIKAGWTGPQPKEE